MLRTRIVSYIKYHADLSAALLSGVLLGVSLNVSFAWWLSMVGLIPLLWLIARSGVRTKKVFFYSWLAGSVYFAVALVWFWHTLPLDWLGISNALIGDIVAGSVWLSVAIALGVFVAIWGLSINLAYVYFGSGALVLAPLLWSALEYARFVGFSILTIGAESLVGAHFSFGAIGYALADSTVLLQLAAFGGIYTLSGVAVAANAIVFFVYSRARTRKQHIICVSVVALLFTLAYALPVPTWGIDKESGKTVSVAAIHTSFPAKMRIAVRDLQSRDETLVQLVARAAANVGEPGIVVLPEDSRFMQMFSERERDAFLATHFGDRDVLLIDSGRTENRSSAYQEIAFYNTREKTIKRHRKQLLVPVGEYMPYAYSTPLRLLGGSEAIQTLEQNRAYMRGNTFETGNIDGVRVAGLFCSELLSPALYNSFRARGADVFVNVASQSWFHGSDTLFHQTVNTAKVRAVANQTPLIYAANKAPAFILDAYGRIRAISKDTGRAGVLYGSVDLRL